jgi:hypothetical protein
MDFCKKGEDFLDCMVVLPTHFQDAMAERGVEGEKW